MSYDPLRLSLCLMICFLEPLLEVMDGDGGDGDGDGNGCGGGDGVV